MPSGKRKESGAPARKVAVIGITGATGGFFARRLRAYGHEVEGFGRAGWGHGGEEILAESDLVIVSVYVERAVEIIARAAKHMRPDAALADVTSVKTPAFAAMTSNHPGPVVGLHPMFGPGVETFLSQTVVVCHGRGRETYQWLLDLVAADGGRIVESTPQEHDRMMVTVQAIRHFTTMGLGVFLAEEGIDHARSLEFASPVYRLELDFVGRLFAQEAGLYADIMLATDERREAVARLAGTFARLAEIARAGDKEALLGEFRKVRESMGPEAARALGESNKVIGLFGRMLAKSTSTALNAESAEDAENGNS